MSQRLDVLDGGDFVAPQKLARHILAQPAPHHLHQYRILRDRITLR
jgi:hypothetical protein